MKINIVRPTDGWVLQRIAEGWKIPGARCSSRPDGSAYVNLWVNYAMFASVGRSRKTRCDVGWFTHRENSAFDRIAEQMDHCIAMCHKTAALLPPEKTTIIMSAPDPQFRRGTLRLGVVCREYPRKQLHLIDMLRSIPGTETHLTAGKYPFDQLPGFYRMVDYVVVLSDNEGGPMCVPEAIAMGKPVIAPDVGWCWDYPVIRYTGIDELLSIVERLTPPTIEQESEQIYEVCQRAAGC